MNISEWLTGRLVDASPSAVLRHDGAEVVDPLPFAQWRPTDSGRQRGSVLFGPYKFPVTASSVRVFLDDAFDDVTFGSVLQIPAGQTYRYTLTVGVT